MELENFKYAVLIGAVVQFVGIYAYIVDTIKGKAIPHRITWGLWGLNGFIAASIGFMHHEYWITVPALVSGIINSSVFIVL